MMFSSPSPRAIDPDMSLDEIMRRWPATVSVFMKNRMSCVGCPIASFHTIVDAAEEYHLDEGQFAEELALARDGSAKRY
jgi:hybrid cluster-associated redox disulfide protein